MIAHALLLLAAQITPMQPMPKGTGLPLSEAIETEPLAAAETVLRAIRMHDAATLFANVTDPDALSVTVAPEAPDTAYLHMSWRANTGGSDSTPGPEQRMTDPAVEVDGNIAMIWSPYVSLREGKVWHCGSVHFDLIRIEGRWKVQSLTRTQRTTGCTAG